MEQLAYHIMVIEDNPGDMLLLNQYIKLSGVRISKLSEAETLQDAINQLTTGKPDLIFLDLFLPDSNALDTFDIINHITPTVPIIILSGMNDSNIATKGIQSGAQDYLIKGEFDEKVLAKTIHYSIERKKIEETLSNSLERHKLVGQATSDVIWDWDITNGKVVHLSHAIENNFGYDESELDDSLEWWYKKVHPQDIMVLEKKISGSLKKAETTVNDSFRFLAKNGEYRLVHARALIVYQQRESRPWAVRMIGVLQDISALKKTEDKLSWSMQRYETISKATSDVVVDWDMVGDVVSYWQDDIEKVFGYKDIREESARWWFDNLHPEDWKKTEKIFLKNIEQHASQSAAEFRFRCADGTYKNMYGRSFFFYDADKLPYRMIGAMQDISELKALQEKVIAEKVISQQKITEATIQSQEQEREELGKELHDNINQILATSKMFVDIAIKNPFLREELLPKSFNYLATAIEELRKLSKSLVPPSLGDIGLEEAIRELLATASMTSATIKYSFSCEQINSKDIPNQLQLMIYRIIQEQLNNIAKYARPTEVSIRLELNAHHLKVSITDNGKGFDTSCKSKGIGLRNIKSRAEMCGGKMKIVSSPGNGCVMNVSIPTRLKERKKAIS